MFWFSSPSFFSTLFSTAAFFNVCIVSQVKRSSASSLCKILQTGEPLNVQGVEILRGLNASLPSP